MTLEDEYDRWQHVFAEEQVPGDALPQVSPEEDPRSWQPLDLSAVLEGTAVRPVPEVGERSDGQCVLYPGKVHTISGESESGKTWFAVAVIIAELAVGRGAGVIDFEDNELGWVGRLVDAGASLDALRTRFFYIRPDEPLGDHGKQDLGNALEIFQPSVVIVDGVTEAMTLHGLDPNKNNEVAAFGKRLPRWMAHRGPAVLCTDHVAKSAEGRGRYAIGAVHKLNGLDGAAFVVDNRRPFGVGRVGVSTVNLSKDRPAMLRRLARPSRGLDWFADLVVDAREGQPLEVRLDPPPAEVAGAPSGTTRPTEQMARICQVIADAAEPLSRQQIEDRVSGRANVKRLALDLLIEEGFVRVEAARYNRRNHFLVRPFVDGTN